MLDTKGQWTSEFPTAEDNGKWFFVKHENGKHKNIYIREVRVENSNRGKPYLCQECEQGITKQTYGTCLDLYSKQHTQFCGPIQMPPNYREIEKEKEKEIISRGTIYVKFGTDIFVKLTSETDGEGGNFGLEYWQIKSFEENSSYVGASPYARNREDIENNSEWQRVN